MSHGIFVTIRKARRIRLIWHLKIGIKDEKFGIELKENYRMDTMKCCL